MNEPKNNYEALVLALQLALTAKKGDERGQECIDFANDLASNLSEFEVERAKKEALERVGKE